MGVDFGREQGEKSGNERVTHVNGRVTRAAFRNYTPRVQDSWLAYEKTEVFPREVETRSYPDLLIIVAAT